MRTPYPQATEASQQGLLSALIEKLTSSANRLDGVGTRMHLHADTIFGPVPVDPAKTLGNTSVPSQVNDLSLAYDALERAVDLVAAAEERFRRL